MQIELCLVLLLRIFVIVEWGGWLGREAACDGGLRLICLCSCSQLPIAYARMSEVAH